MNILVFSWRDPKHPQAGGAEQVMHEHMKGWIQAGHTVTLFSSFHNGAKRNENLDGVKIIRKGYHYLGVHLLGVLYYLVGRHKKYDMVVDQFHGIPFFTPLFVRVPKLAVLQEVAREVWLRNDLMFPFNKIIGLIGYYGEPFVYILYKKIHFMVGSSSAKEDLVEIGIPKNNITIVEHGVLLDDKPKNMPKREKVNTIVFLGAHAKDKGIEDALRAFSIINKKGEFRFWTIGKCGNDYLSELKKIAKELVIDTKITFWGYVSNPQKFELLGRAHLMVNPSLLEGFGLVNIEANAMGTPVVGYTSRGLVDSIKDGESGYLVHPNTPQELASKILYVMREKNKLKRLHLSAKKWSKQFTWEKSRARSLKLIETLN